MAKKSKVKKDPYHQTLSQIATELTNLTSYKQTFKRGLIKGIGSAIGATIIAAVVLSILGAAINSIEDIPLIRELFNR